MDKNTDCGARWLRPGLHGSLYVKSLQQSRAVSVEVLTIINNIVMVVVVIIIIILITAMM